MLRKAEAFMLVCALASSHAFAADLPRAGSTSLCGDAYLLALAPERAAALSWQSRDAVSRGTEEQKRRPQIWDTPERLVSAPVDHIIFGPGEGVVSTRYLSKTSKSSSALIWGEDFDNVRANFQDLGEAILSQEKASELTTDLDRRLAALTARMEKRSAPANILYLSRAGGTAGPGTFVDAVIMAAGGRNVVTNSGWITLDPETIMSLKPDFIVTSFMEDGYESANANGLRHKILRDFIQARPSVNIPGALWPCAGPALIEAAERIADGLDKLP